MKKLFVTLLALAAMCLAPASYANCGHCQGDQGKDACLNKMACTNGKTCSAKICPDCKDSKLCDTCKAKKMCPDCKDGKMCDVCKAKQTCPDCKDGKVCDACKAKMGHRRHHRGWFRRGHGHRHNHCNDGRKVSHQPRSEGAETLTTTVAPTQNKAAPVSPIAPAAAPVAGVIEKTGIIEVTHYGPWNKVDKVLFKTGGEVFKLVPTHESHHQLQEINQYNGKTVNLKGEVCPIDRHHTEPSIKVHSISETK